MLSFCCYRYETKPLPRSCRTPLHYAAAFYSSALVDLLLRNGASLFLRNSEGQTALETVREEATSSVEGTNQMVSLCFKNMSCEFKMTTKRDYVTDYNN